MILIYALVWFTLWVGIVFLIRAFVPALNFRFRLRALANDSTFIWRMPAWARYIFVPRKSRNRELYKELLLAAGAGIDFTLYFVLKRSIGFTVIVLMFWQISYGQIGSSLQILMLTFLSIILLLVSTDRIWLEQVGRGRRQAITAEIYQLCHQLAYYAGSRMNLHAKLTRCEPITNKIRREWSWLLQEWYEDPEEALYRFRLRLGTDEAYSFTETLSALRQGEDEAFYRLLAQRIKDYKNHLDLVQEGKRETYSYALFVLAGLPIMNTFRVFIHPWVEEGSKLFQQLQ